LESYAWALNSGEDDGTAGLGNLYRRANWCHSFRGHVDDNVGAFSVRQLAHPLNHVLIGKDGFVRAEYASQREAMGALAACDNQHGCSPGLARGDNRSQAALACSENYYRVTHPSVGFTMRPANTSSKRLKQCGELRRNVM